MAVPVAPLMLAGVLAASVVAPPPPSPAPSPIPGSSSSASGRSAAASASLEGTVVGPDGKPVKDALVVARSVAGIFPEAPLTTRTDAAGRFRLALRSGGLHSVRVETPGLAPYDGERIRPGTPLRITLARGGTIEGTVRDGPTEVAVAGALVEARADRFRGTGAVWETGAGVAEAKTDGQGRYRLTGLGPGVHTVTARARGFGSAVRRGVAVGSRADLTVYPAGAISGSVRGPDGKPAAEVPVLLEPHMGFRIGGPPVQVTDAAGRFEFLGVEPGAYRVVARPAKLAPAWLSNVTVARLGEATADIVLSPPLVLTGRLADEEDRPVKGRVVVAEFEGSGVPGSLVPLLAAEATADGRFRLGPLPTGSHVLAVRAPAFAPKRVDADVVVARPVTDLGTVVLESGLAIRGRVKDRAGNGVGDVRLMVSLSMGSEPRDATSESDGSFVIGGLQPGTYRVTASAPAVGTVERQVAAGAEPIDLVLEPFGSITGVVVDDSGPVPSFRASARPVERGGRMMMTMANAPQQTDNPEGRFTLPDLTAGTYNVEVIAPDRIAGSASNVTVTAGGTVDVGRIRLGAGGVIRGSVADASGTSIAGASVTVQGPGRSFAFMGGPSEAASDTSGQFELRGVPAGGVRVVARHPGYAEAGATVDVDPAKGASEVRLTMLHGGRIEGRVRRQDGAPVNGGISVMPTSPGPMSFSPANMLPLAADGSFVAEHVPAGRVRVMLMMGSGGRMQSSGQQREVDVREGETTAVEFLLRDILVTGRVTRGGTPAPNLRVSVRPEAGMAGAMQVSVGGFGPTAPSAGPQPLVGLTREDGSYELLVDTPGRASVSVATVDNVTRFPNRTVEIPDVERHVLDFDFAVTTVSGIVVDGDSDQPLGDTMLFARREGPTGQGGPGGTFAHTDAAGRFQLQLDPGEYRLEARHEGYMTATLPLKVEASGAADQRIELRRGGRITGRVVDEAGRPMGGVSVTASPPQEGRSRSGTWATTSPDGTFEIGGLADGDYNMFAHSMLGDFALRPGVRTGTEGLRLVATRGGRVALTVLGADGTPLPGSSVAVTRVAGMPNPGVVGGRTDGRGQVEIPAPAGVVELFASTESLRGTITVTLTENVVTAAELRLVPKKTMPVPPQ